MGFVQYGPRAARAHEKRSSLRTRCACAGPTGRCLRGVRMEPPPLPFYYQLCRDGSRLVSTRRCAGIRAGLPIQPPSTIFSSRMNWHACTRKQERTRTAPVRICSNHEFRTGTQRTASRHRLACSAEDNSDSESCRLLA